MDMTERRMKSDEVRKNWRDVLDAVEDGTTIVVERYQRPVATIAPLARAKETAVITLYETNSDLLVMARNAVAWDIGAPGGDYLNGTFAADAQAWAEGAWEPNAGDGQMPTEIDDDLTAVATWEASQGMRLLVDRVDLGGAADVYLYGRAPAEDPAGT